MSLATTGARARLSLVLVACVLAFSACPKGTPIVKQRRFSAPQVATGLLAVLPFYPRPSLSRHAGQGGPTAAEAAELVTRFVTEAIASEGIAVVAATDVEIAFTSSGSPVPRLDPRTAASLTARKFGATGVLLGEVLRYRERGGEAMGTTQPASVSFLVTLYDAPEGNKLWSAQFDETQQTITENVLRTRRYPGRGTRWLTAGEFARWGAQELATALRAAR